MTCQNDPEIRRCADGTIDFAFYASRARGLRGEAIMRSPSHLAPRARRFLSAAGRIMVTIRSVMVSLTPPRHARTGSFPGPDAQGG